MAETTQTTFDVLIRGGRIVDGTGNPWFYGDLALRGEEIAAIAPPGTIDPASAADVVDASGHVVSPGFVDIQSHSLVPLLTDGRALSKITQGVTTEIMGESWTPSPFGGRISEPFDPALKRRMGEDAWAEWDALGRTWERFGDWLAELERRGTSPNVGSFIGGGTLREYACGMDMREATEDELQTMRDVMAEAMKDGAFGVATALIYPPSAYADFDELVEVMKVVAEHHGVHITHVRSEGNQLLEGIDEAIAIARETGAATEIYHLKAAGKGNWHKMPQVIAMIDRARADGIDVTVDMYPYEAAGTGLASCLPYWASEGNRLFEFLADPAARARMREEMIDENAGWENLGLAAGPEGLMVAGISNPEITKYRGRFIADIAAERGQDWRDTVMDLLSIEGANIATIYFLMNEDNVRLQLRQPWIKVSTDAGGIDPAQAAVYGPIHPRAYGTYTRVLAKYVREEGIITLEDAVRKMSSSVCDRLGLRDRGLLREGLKADVIVFDPATVQDHSTWTDPHQLSTGIRDVWVNGGRVLRDGEHTGATPGQWVKGPGYAGA
ncbi:MAG TPA: D-aminoacylase [Thermomicrobiales bacterium]|jgi:dihydroorotase/N-acyl-D-amino-acid deacylase|nr:D-aminoacylase [Thermomicrobiales bacterium]